MTLGKNLLSLCKRLNIDVSENPKGIADKIKVMPLPITYLDSLIEKHKVIYWVEPFIVYNKFLDELELKASPEFGDKVVKLLRFNPEHIQLVFQHKKYFTTGLTRSIRDEWDSNFLIISNDIKALENKKQFLKASFLEVNKNEK